MKTRHWNLASLLFGIVSLCAAPLAAYAFESGSTGIDGVFNPTVNTELQLPPDGIFNFTGVNIPSDVTVSFVRNVTNTPVTILASGDVTIGGVLNLVGGPGANSGPSGDGNIGDDRIPGAGGPGGFDGGFGGFGGSSTVQSGKGLGPGGGLPDSGISVHGAGGGGFGTPGARGRESGGIGGGTYGNEALLPLIGGSGGGGGDGGSTFDGGAGGGGGGAILIAASGTLTVTGTINANGGPGGSTAGGSVSAGGGGGGGGSGGAIRLVATTITGNGFFRALGGANGFAPGEGGWAGPGGAGRIRIEAESLADFSVNTNPGIKFAGPGDIFVAGFPSLRITSVAGVAAPMAPTGNADIILPSDTQDVTVEFETSNVPLGNTVTLEVVPNIGPTTKVESNALSGSEALATASVVVDEVDFPDGPSVLQAQLSFTVTASLGDALRNFAQGERVARIQLAAAPGQGSTTTFISVSGKVYTWPSSAVAMN